MKKKWTYGIIVLLVIAIIAYIAIDISSKSKKASKIKPSYNQFVYYHTTGIISKKASIRVQFTRDVAEEQDIGEEVSQKILDFEPRIKGKSYWTDKRTIEFKPEKDLQQGTIYACHVFITDLLPEEPNAKDFEFRFETMRQSFDVIVDELKTIDKKTLKYQRLTGTIITADFENTDNVKEILQAKLEDKPVRIKWVDNIESKEHSFTIDSLERKEEALVLLLEWDGDPINSSITGNLIMEVPALGDFKVVGSKIFHAEEQYVQVTFSEPIKANQELRGLLTIQGISNLDFVIEDNSVKIYPPSRLRGNYKLQIHEGIKNVIDYKLKKGTLIDLVFEKIKPAVRLVSKGSILPSGSQGVVLPFECVNLKAVDVQVVKIYDNNIMQFLQVNNMKGSNQIRRVGKPVIQKTIPLDPSNVVDLGSWNRFTLDLNDLIRPEPGAIYNITIGFREKHSVYSCGESEDEDEDDSEQVEDEWTTEEEEQSFWDNFENYYYSGYYYSWEHRDDPCHAAYYGSRRSVSQNILATDIGIIAKRGKNDSISIYATDLKTTDVLSNVTIEIYDYQQQLIEKSTTNNDGMVSFVTDKDAYFVIAKKDKERAYLRLQDGESLSMSMFDVSGTSVKKGLKGYIYGERGVWRPGDSIYISFILEENALPLPENHPIIFELRDPNNKLTHRMVQTKNPHNLYAFKLKTNTEDITGNWLGKVKVGSNQFTKTIKIETIKPNRLKINFDLDEEYIVRNQKLSTKINVTWLHGAVAKNLDTKIDLVLNPKRLSFPKFSEYSFNDQSKTFSTEKNTIFEESLNEQGEALFETQITAGAQAPGMLTATFMTKVFEKSGNFSVDQFSKPYHPYDNYVGINKPKGDKRGMLLTDTTHHIEIVLVDHEGKLLQEDHPVEMEFYKLEWRWWWDNSYNNLANYINRTYNRPLKKETVKTTNGKAKWNIRINYPDWGRYLVRAHDLQSGHSSTKIVYIDWPGWAGRSRGGAEGASMLTFSVDKEKYEVGEKVELTIPSSGGGRGLVSIESGSKVIQSYWISTKDKETKFTFPATAEMSPNVYVHVTLLQPHAQTANDLPIRLYGIVPLTVENPASHISPELTMPDELESESVVDIKVTEQSGKSMVYTIAMVDEGLLDITRFKTPDPWKTFYAKEALGVKTWDMYDDVIGAFGGSIERLLTIGGGEEIDASANKKANRFKPMVRFLGPYYLEKGKTNTHSVDIPRYIGSVRTMIIARNNKAYGASEKTTPVKKPLMVLGTLPRVLGPGESTNLPVNVFVMDESIKTVDLELVTNDLFIVDGSKKQKIRFEETGEKMTHFALQIKPELGIGKVEIIASSGRHKAIYDIEIDIRNPNPPVTEIITRLIDPGDKWETSFEPVGIKGTNSGTLEISTIPPINLGSRLKFLIRYPHGCIEQTTSAVFPQLFLEDILELDQDKKKDIEWNVKRGIQRLASFQLSNGGFAYWPGNSNVSIWGTNYAGHFMLEAKQKGYTIPSGMLNDWIKYQKRKATNWTDDGNRSQLVQAYRLYTLALAQKPEIGAMNRLREKSNLTPEAKWRLAAAYKLIGKDKIAQRLTDNLTTHISPYRELGYTFGSALRDQALILETLTLLDNKEKAFGLLTKISEKLNTQYWYSTQTTAYCLVSISKYVRNTTKGAGIDVRYQLNNGKENTLKSNNPIAQKEIPLTFTLSQTLDLVNDGEAMVYAKLILTGQPEVGDDKDADNNMNMVIRYLTAEGDEFNPSTIQQGTDFIAEVTIKHTGILGRYENIALSQIFPSGWEIINTRTTDLNIFDDMDSYTYQDIRDDRVYTYFDIGKNQTKTYKVLLNAAYPGRYYLPTTYAEAMYDNEINSKRHGMWVEVVK